MLAYEVGILSHLVICAKHKCCSIKVEICRSIILVCIPSQTDKSKPNALIQTDFLSFLKIDFSPSVVAMTYSFVQKLISSLGATIVGLAVASIGYVETMPQATDAFSRPILNIALFLWLGMPMLGYVCTLIAMKFYKLDQKTMEEVSRKNAAMRAEK